MTILQLYKQLCLNPAFFEKYYSTSEKNNGKIFSFINTNYRGILIESRNELQGFANGFRVIENVEGQKRSNWARRVGTQQEVEKQHVVNMRKSEFFRVVEDAYQKTSRGIVFKKLIEDKTLIHAEKNLICLLLLLAGYFSDIPNYIIEQTKVFFNRCIEAGYSEIDILKAQESFIKKACATKKVAEIFTEEYIIIDSFYQTYADIDFLKAYHESPIIEKAELHDNIVENYKNRNYDKKTNGCVISYKYKPGGNYVKKTVVDNAWILYVVKHLIDANCKDYDSFITVAINAYKKLFNINESHIRKFVFNPDKNRSVLQVIFYKVTGVPFSPLMVEKDLTEEEIRELRLSDATDLEGAAALDTVSSTLKKLAKLNTGYKCVLEDCEMCTYFTAKENNKNYLEIHHLIPREFSNDFDAPIEILDNYVALCPKCHKKIHLAVDGERKHMINSLYTQRKDKLSAHGLHVELRDLYNYYKID